MKNKSYSDKLKDPRWQKKRLEILERDRWCCCACGADDKTLHVHHLVYEKSEEPWDYENHLFATLCEDCHSAEFEHRKFIEDSIIYQLKIDKYFVNGDFSIQDVERILGDIHDAKLICEIHSFEIFPLLSWLLRSKYIDEVYSVFCEERKKGIKKDVKNASV